MNEKVKITQKDFDDIYEIEGITGDTEVKSEQAKEYMPVIPDKQHTTPTNTIEFSEQEEELDDKFHEDYPIEGDIT